MLILGETVEREEEGGWFILFSLNNAHSDLGGWGGDEAALSRPTEGAPFAWRQ